MQNMIRGIVLTAVVMCASVVSAGCASAATLEAGASSAFVAVYGSPPATGPVGGGLGRDFGVGENMLFQATSTAPEHVFSITLGGNVKTAQDSYFGGTVTANKTGANVPLGLTVGFVDFQKSFLTGVGEIPEYSDTFDRPWSANICAPTAATCKTDPRFVSPAGGVQINDVTIQETWPSVGTLTLQGTIFGVWTNGTEEAPPCIEFVLPPSGAASDQTLMVTKSAVGLPAVGVKITAIAGKACLVSANNDYYEGHDEVIKIANE